MKNIKSNKDVDWGKHYDYYETEFREMYRSKSKKYNDSHHLMLTKKGKKYLSKKNVFCEVGFGAGITLRYALKYFKKVYGLDISKKNIDATKDELVSEGYKNFELFQDDLMIYNSNLNNKFDVISFIHGLEHFSDTDYPIVLSNISKYLKKGGVFTGALPYKNPFNYRMCPECNHVFEYDGHVSSHSIKSLSDVFLKNNFKIIYINNFNIYYTLKNEKFLKKIYKGLNYFLLNKRPIHQLEFIVRPD